MEGLCLTLLAHGSLRRRQLAGCESMPGRADFPPGDPAHRRLFGELLWSESKIKPYISPGVRAFERLCRTVRGDCHTFVSDMNLAYKNQSIVLEPQAYVLSFWRLVGTVCDCAYASFAFPCIVTFQ